MLNAKIFKSFDGNAISARLKRCFKVDIPKLNT